MKTIALFLLLVIHTLPSLSQGNRVNLSGVIADSISKTKLINATILLKFTNDTLQQSAVTDEKGNFLFKDVLPGKYILKISHVGFVTVTKELLIDKNADISVWLLKDNTQLSNILILSDKKLISHTNDRITYNVSEGAITASDNLYNIILKVPGVMESNGTLFYQGRPLNILLDNKSNNLSGEDLKNYLSGMLGTSVDKLEILLNPSSKYDAQGGSVFNIRSAKNKNYGLTESITVGAGTGRYFRYNGGFAFNYRNTKLNLYGGYDFNHNEQFIQLDVLMRFNSNPASVEFSEQDIRKRNHHSVRFGMDYDISKKTSVGVLFRGLRNFRRRDVFNSSVYIPGTGDPDTIATLKMGGNSNYIIPSLNLFVKTQLSSKGAEIMLNADFFGSYKKWDDDLVIRFTDRLGKQVASPDLLNNRSPADNSVKSITADYIQPLPKGKIEMGLKVVQSKTDNNVLWQQLFNNSWKTDSARTNHFIYTEKIYASYINFFKNYGKWTLQTGLRLEATRADGASVSINKRTKNNHDNLFPSISAIYKYTTTQQVSINFRRSIRRFGFDIMNPFVIQLGQYAYHQGNPYIKPSYFNSVDVSWSYKSKLVINGGYSSVKDPMSYGYRKNTNNNSSIGTFLNFSSGRLYTGSLNYTEKFFKKWTSINAVTFLHSELPDFYSNTIHSNSYTLNSVNTITLPAKITMEISGFFNSGLLDGTVGQRSFYGMSFGITKPVLRSKGSLKLGCVDVFDTQILHFHTQGDGLKINSHWKRESRFINLLFTYRFGNLNVKANKNRTTGIEEERSRMGNN